MDVRVVCGLLATIAILAPMSWFSSVDLPALGRPRIETNPDFIAPPAANAAHAPGLRAGHRWPGYRCGCRPARRILRIAARDRAIQLPVRRRWWIPSLPPDEIRADRPGAPHRNCPI